MMGGNTSIQGVEVAKVDEFKYLGLNVQSNKEYGRKVTSAGRVEWLEKSVRSDLQQEGTSKNKREGLQNGSESSYVIWAGDCGTVEDRRQS